ncbi:MAG TPA: NYN domain-containing protein [Verrucomicrobiae bacterium]|nr:NYN domain-containing protein [Verrucomicrobiae bacterium]
MSLVRILVDGYSLLHNWPELAPGQARHSAPARDALVEKLTQYHDATGTPVSIFFDGSFARGAGPKPHSTAAVEVLFSSGGQTADDLIERAAHRFQPYGQVLVVTDDMAERETVIALGASAASCDNFIAMVQAALHELANDLKHHNRNERNRFNRRQ